MAPAMPYAKGGPNEPESGKPMAGARGKGGGGGASGKRPGLGSNTCNCSPPTLSSPVTWPSTVTPVPSGMATNCLMVPCPAQMPSSHGCGGVTR